MYQLYFNKKEKELRIEPMRVMGGRYIKPDKIVKFNDCYYISDSRKLLQAWAKELKEKWIGEASYDLVLLQDMKIRNKYK